MCSIVFIYSLEFTTCIQTWDCFNTNFSEITDVSEPKIELIISTKEKSVLRQRST